MTDLSRSPCKPPPPFLSSAANSTSPHLECARPFLPVHEAHFGLAPCCGPLCQCCGAGLLCCLPRLRNGPLAAPIRPSCLPGCLRCCCPGALPGGAGAPCLGQSCGERILANQAQRLAGHAQVAHHRSGVGGGAGAGGHTSRGGHEERQEAALESEPGDGSREGSRQRALRRGPDSSRAMLWTVSMTG